MSYLILFLCGILTALPYVFEYAFFLPYVTIAPLFIVAATKKSTYRHGLSFSMGYYLVVYHWFVYLYPLDFAGINSIGSIAVIAVAWLGLSLLQALGMAFIPLIYKLITRSNHQSLAPFAAASLWCICEWAQNLFWFGVPWARIAVTQHKILPIVQSASIFGALGVGFLIVLISATLSKAYFKYKNKLGIRYDVIVCVVIFLSNFFFGLIAMNVPSKSNTSVTAAAIQGNICSTDKWIDGSYYTSFQKYAVITEEAVENSGASLVIWPETVLVCDLNYYPQLLQEISLLSQRLNCYIALGSYYNTGDDRYNIVCLFHPDGKQNEKVYKKRRLVPFGEFIPMAGLLYALVPQLKEINMLDKPLTAGTDSEIFETDLGKLGTLICFDSIYEMLTVDTVRDGAELIILSTNDSWYKDSAAVRQHNGHAVLRAIENGRYIVRSANTGISTIITDKGRVINQLDALREGYISAEVKLCSSKTVYTVTGNLIVIISFAYVMILSYMTLSKRK
jgi:apolipoprotein N-acyltransferase